MTWWFKFIFNDCVLHCSDSGLAFGIFLTRCRWVGYVCIAETLWCNLSRLVHAQSCSCNYTGYLGPIHSCTSLSFLFLASFVTDPLLFLDCNFSDELSDLFLNLDDGFLLQICLHDVEMLFILVQLFFSDLE